MKVLNRWLSLGIILILGCFLGLLGNSIWDQLPSAVNRVDWSSEAQWITSQETTYRFFATRRFSLSDPPRSGWLRVSADNDFVLYVNGRVVAQELSYQSQIPRNSLGLAAKISDPFQKFNDGVAYNLYASDWIQMPYPRDWKLTSYVDISSYLQTGKNVIGLEVQNSTKKPRVVLEGTVYTLAESAPINLTTGATPWRVSALSYNHQRLKWSDPHYSDESWLDAKQLGRVTEATYSRLSKNLFSRPLQGNWIAGDENSQGEVWLRGLWEIPNKQSSRAFIRVAGDRDFYLLINDLLVNRFVGKQLDLSGPATLDDQGQLVRFNGTQLYLIEVTNFLRPGINTIGVRLARLLDPDWSATKNGVLTPTGAIQFFLDGWVETDRGEMIAPIATDANWMTLTEPVSGWTEGKGTGEPAIAMQLPQSQEFKYNIQGDGYLFNYPNYLWHQGLWCAGGIISTLIYAWGFGRFWLARQNGWWDSLGAGTALLLPGTLFLMGIGLLKHRYAEAEKGLLFAQPQSNALILLTFIAIVLLTLLWSQIRQNSPTWHHLTLCFLLGLMICIGLGWATGGNAVAILLAAIGILVLTLISLWGGDRLRDSYGRLRQTWPTWGHWVLLGAIAIIGFSLRVYNLDFADLDPDENVSLDAVRGILRTGAPITTAEIWYTRSPFFHYLLALWLRIVGDSFTNARFLSVLWGTATLIVVYIFTHQVTGKVWIALIVTALLALDPWEIWYSRNIRFYQATQCLYLLSFWLFFRGFMQRAGKWYQHLFFLSVTLMLLSQEATLTLLPVFFLGFFYFYRPFRWSSDWSIILGFVMTMGVFSYNATFFIVKTLTPLAGLSSMTISFIKFRIFYVSFFANEFLVGFNRMHILYSCLFFAGLLYFIICKNSKIAFFYSSVIINLILLTLLVALRASRYTYPFYPLLIMLSVYGIFCIAESLDKNLESLWKKPLFIKGIATTFAFLLLLGNIEPGRILNSYNESITARHLQVSEYIREHWRDGDVVISNVPAVHANTLGGADYYVPHRGSFFDAVYWKNGRLIDRWEGRQLLTNPDQFSHILAKANRVWIHLIHQPQLPKDYDFAKFHALLRTTGQPVLETFGTDLRLWQKDDGLLRTLPNRGRDLGAY
ncbi:MAG: glycosyl transferase [Spirulina sp. SIO3F2]|nr:glycosyl transferase [Spirulina sp. SIO3F2]